ncbi:uncharacterized protein [Haliotis asinina]|uniref:uncharacterized protein n=1 Tax=Haliotis asinina TaxID=109174 RepID=UPI0035327B0F
MTFPSTRPIHFQNWPSHGKKNVEKDILCRMEVWVITLILTYLVTSASSLMKTGLGKQLEIFSNVIITTDVLSEVSNTVNDVECVSLCLKTEACVSAFYRPQHRRCQLHDVLFMSPKDGQREIGAVYYSLTTGTCPPGYIHNRPLNFCYQLHLDKAKYADGLADCNSRGEHFLVIDSPDKQSHFVKQVTASSDSIKGSYYIDGSDAATEGQWVYHDGQPVTYFAWDSGFPNNVTTNRDYLVALKFSEFRWQDRESDHERCYACEKHV